MGLLVPLWLLVSLALMVGGMSLAPRDALGGAVLGTAGLVLALLGTAVLVYTNLYVRTSANESFFRTGWGKPTVIIDGGALVVPGFHELTRVLLETMNLQVVRQGPDALICKDFLRVDVSAEFFIRVNKNDEGVKAAATTLGRDAAHPAKIKERLLEKLVSALRTVAATMELNELHQNRDEFAARVQDAIAKDIRPNGFILETVTISQLDQTDVKLLKKDNVFDAQGLRKAAEITNEQLVIKNRIERQAEIAMTQENVVTRQRVLEQERARAFAETDQKAQVKLREAERLREVSEFEIAQAEQVESRRVAKDRALRALEIQREAALVAEEKARETAEIEKKKALELAFRQQQIEIAQAEALRAEAEATQRDAEAKEREAAERAITAAVLEVARRERDKAVLQAEQEGERQLIEVRKAADAEAYTKVREAEAEKLAAENRALARVRIAEADLQARRREAEGLKAVEMIPVEVETERVGVEAKRVEVLRQELEAKDAHQQTAIHLELARLQVSASKEVGIAMAEAFGKFMAQGQFQIFGDPNTLATMTERFAQGLGVSQIVSGLKDGNPLLGNIVEQGLEAAAMGLAAAKVKAQEVVVGSLAGPAEPEREEVSEPVSPRPERRAA